MRLRTQGTEKTKGKDNWYEKQENGKKFAQFTVIIKQLKQLGSKEKLTDTKTEVTMVRESHIGYRRSRRTSVNKPKTWAKANPRSLASLPKANSHTHRHNQTLICMKTDNTNTFLAFGQVTDNLWPLMLLSCWCTKVDARNSPCSHSVTMNHTLGPLMLLVSGVYNAIKKVWSIESRGILFTNNTWHGIDFNQ